MSYTIKQPETVNDFKQYYFFRWKLLRAPWNEPEGSEKDAIENDCFHIMVIDGHDRCIGVGRLQLNTKNEAQIRYMAVAKTHERNGIGTMLIEALENRARENNIEVMVLDARAPATGFYQRLGYTQKEKSYLLFGSIQHYRMVKSFKSNHKEKPA